MKLSSLITVLERDTIDGRFQTHTFMMIYTKDINSYADCWLEQEEKQFSEPEVYSLDNFIDLLKGKK